MLWLFAELLTVASWIGVAMEDHTPARELMFTLAVGLTGLSSPFVAYAAIRAARADDQGVVDHAAELEALTATRNVMGVVLAVVLYLGALLGVDGLLGHRDAPVPVAVTYMGLFGGPAALGLSITLHRFRHRAPTHRQPH